MHCLKYVLLKKLVELSKGGAFPFVPIDHAHHDHDTLCNTFLIFSI